MKHHILVKWNTSVTNKESLIPSIENIFKKSTTINGIHSVSIHKNIVDRSNRYDLLIIIDMDKEALPIYDESDFHKEWKARYSSLIESKAIFDCD